ncbi:choline-sulfatase [Ochrobactrum sp. CM-21-5]|nr:choline-sulfatase [Ochrobactrum sp. CM-21-5]MBC2885173.1 choline-sulfatase [Ochrobactrum sp. CM-21-5]
MIKPNILVLMADQLNGTFFPDGPAEFLHVPNLRKLAARSVRFANCYTASPLCAPARASFMSGQLPSRTGVYDNAAEFSSEIPTYAHHLRSAGYQTALSGKMHFVGPDQLHGFEQRLTTDIYPADFGWTPDYRKPNERIDWWYHNLGSITGAGAAEITNQLEYDDEVAYQAEAKLYDLARGHDPRPWCLTVSFTHPHDPYVARKRFFDLYAGIPELDPKVGPLPKDKIDPHAERLLRAAKAEDYDLTSEQIRTARQAYFANISYIDEKIGSLLDVIERCGMADNTVVIFTSDHGDMLGERGMWFKMSFFEGSARVPLMIAVPQVEPSLIEQPVSTLDVVPTLADLAGIDLQAILPWTDGVSLVEVASGSRSRGVVPCEYAAEGTIAPMVSLREGSWKLNLCQADPAQLFNIDDDPDELRNLAAEPECRSILEHLVRLAGERWDLERYDADVRASQARRHIVYPALRNGAYYPWDHQPLQKASERYMRNHMDLNMLEENQRFPR